MIKQQVRFQNSYRLESNNPFKRDVVEVILKKVMEKHFSTFEQFDSKLSVSLCRTVTEDIIELIKEKNFERYKLVVVVSACEKFMQGITYASKNLWDSASDSSVTYIYDHPGFTAIGICYAVYYE